MAEAGPGDVKGATRANLAFYQSFEALVLPAMQRVWLADDRVQCVHPGGELLIGRKLVLDSFHSIFEHTEAIRFELTDVRVEVAGDAAWATLVERIRLHVEGQVLDSQAAATNVFVRTPDGWRMAVHHASPVQRRFYPPGT